jgi:hypothetical protein
MIFLKNWFRFHFWIAGTEDQENNFEQDFNFCLNTHFVLKSINQRLEFLQNISIYNIKMKVCVYVCVYVRRPAAGPTQAITSKFGMGSSFHPGSAPSQGATLNVNPQGYLL